MELSTEDGGASKNDVAEVLAAGNPQEKKPTAVEEDVDDVPDPDEDDLDDLDDMLNDFSAVQLDAKKPATPPGPSGPATASVTEGAELSEDDFSEQLQAGMADLLGELDGSPEMHAQFQTIFKQLGAAASESADEASWVPPVHPGSSSTGGAASTEASFQETIRRTMERMQASGDQATAAAAAEGSGDFITELLKQMQGSGLDGEGNEEELSNMLSGIMEQLTNKEILYEPMKELDEKFPEWIEKNRDKVSQEDLARYEEQQRVVKDMVLKFEEATYSDSNTADREYIVDRMQKMQAAGSPPSDLVGEMPSAQEALTMPDESCNPQ